MAKKAAAPQAQPVSKKQLSKVSFCGCSNDPRGNSQAAQYQDERYGKGMRIHNVKMGKGDFTCTVCGKIRG